MAVSLANCFLIDCFFNSTLYPPCVAVTPPIIAFNGVACANSTSNAAFFPSVRHDTLTCISPVGFGAGKSVNVTVAGQSSAGRGSELLPVIWNYDAPVVYSIFPASGPTAGAHITNITSDGVNYALDTPIVVTVKGANFGADMSAGALWFKQPPEIVAAAAASGSLASDILVPSMSIISWNHSTIVFFMPPIEYRLGYVGSGLNLHVTVVIGGQSSADNTFSPIVQFNYDPPSVLRILPFGVPLSQCADRKVCFKFGASNTSKSCKLIPAGCFGTEVRKEVLFV